MSVRLNEAWLERLGVTGSKEQLTELLQYAAEECELRVGNIIASKLSDEQLDEFDHTDNDSKRLEWLEKVYPDYQAVVDEQFKQLSDEIKASNDKQTLIKSWA